MATTCELSFFRARFLFNLASTSLADCGFSCLIACHFEREFFPLLATSREDPLDGRSPGVERREEEQLQGRRAAPRWSGGRRREQRLQWAPTGGVLPALTGLSLAGPIGLVPLGGQRGLRSVGARVPCGSKNPPLYLASTVQKFCSLATRQAKLLYVVKIYL